MNTVDERVVQMHFDNSKFESGVQTSIKSLDMLKKSLNLEGAAKGLSDLDRAGRSFSLAGIGSGVEAIQNKFTALGIIGVTALANITNSAVNAGKRIISALTIDPIKTGFQEYETKMNAIQTILTNTATKGTTLEDVNKTLSDLNEYSDKTIYNFAEMTRNIGTFTAAGIDLETSATAIKGIANLAAGSGSNAQQASTAMYQLSQALASGSVKLMDWNSVVNAGMGGELFQNALKKTAKGMGKVIDSGKPFRETLQDGWLTADVLTKTLQQFADDPALVKAATEVKTFTQLFDTMKESVQSGWATTWEHVIGTKAEAAKTLTAINDAFGKIVGSSADARNNALAFWHAQGGRDTLVNALTIAMRGLGSILKPIGEAFRSVFPAITGTRLLEITAKFHELMMGFKIGEKTTENLRNTFKGIFSILDFGKDIIFAVVGVMAGMFKVVLPLIDGLLAIGGAFGKYVSALHDAIKASSVFQGIGLTINAIFSTIAETIRGFVTIIVAAFEEFANIKTDSIDEFGNRMTKRLEPLKAIGGAVDGILTKLGETFGKIAPKMAKAGTIVGDVFAAMGTAISNAIRNFDFGTALDVFNAGIFTTILLGIKKLTGGFEKFVVAGNPLKGFVDILDGVRGSLEAYQNNLQAKTLLTIATAIGILSVALIALSLVDPKRLTGALAAIGGLFVELFVSMALFEKATAGAKFKGIYKLSGAMVVLSTAILLLSFAMRNIATMDWAGVAKGLITIAILSKVMTTVAADLNKSGKKLMKGTAGLVIFAVAIKILADVVKELGALDPATLAKGLISIGVLVTGLSIFLNKTSLEKSSLGKGVGLIALAVALNILAEAVEKFGSMNIPTLLKGLAAMGVVLTQLAIFTKATGNAKNVISTAIGLTILGVAMNIFATALIKMGSMPLENIAKGLFAMGGALTAVVIAMNLMPKNMVGMGVGLIAVSAAMLILSNALAAMGQMKGAEIAKSLIALGGSLTIIAIAMQFMTGALPGAAALLVVSAALAVLAPTLKILGSMSLSEIGVGLMALAGAFAVLGIASLVLAPLIPVMIGLSVAIGLLGIGVAAIGGGILAFSAGLAALAVSGVAGSAALVTIVASIANLVPMLATKLGEAIIALAGVITAGALPLAKSIVAVIVALAQTVVTALPKLVDAGMKIVLGLLKGISDNIGKIASTAVDIVVNFTRAIAKKLPEIIQAGYDLILAFINGLASSIRKNTKALTEAMGNLISAMLESAVTVLTSPVKGVISIGKNIVEGIITGIKNFFGNGVEAMKNLGTGLLTGIKNVLGIQSPSRVMRDEVGRYIVEGIAEGITKNMSAEEAATKKAENIVSAFKTAFSKLDLGLTTKNLEYELWSSVNGGTASGLDKSAKEAALLGEQLKVQKEKVTLAKSEYETMLKTLGPNNDQVKEAYNRYLTEQIALSKQNASMEQTRKDEAARVQETTKAYYLWMAENAEGLVKLGFSMKDIEAAARDATGFVDVGNGKDLAKDMSANVETAVTTAMGTVKNVYEEKSEKTFGGLLGSFSQWGGTYADGIGTTFLGTIKTVMDKIKTALDTDGQTLNHQVSSIVLQLQSLMSGDMTSSPVIRPVMDLTDVKAGTNQMKHLISGSGTQTGIKVTGVKAMVTGIATSLGKMLGVSSDSKTTKGSTGASISLTQNNYSPKALSRTEIYRQTKTQLSTLKGLVS